MTRSEYDIGVNTFSPEGRIFQVEYAIEAIKVGFCIKTIWAVACDFQQCGILTSVDSDEHVQLPFKLRNFKWCSVSSLIFIEYSSN